MSARSSYQPGALEIPHEDGHADQLFGVVYLVLLIVNVHLQRGVRSGKGFGQWARREASVFACVRLSLSESL